MPLKDGRPLQQRRLLGRIAQGDVDDIGKGQPIGITLVLYCQDVSRRAYDALTKEKAHRQFVIVAGGTHNNGKAAVIDAHLKGLFNRQSLFTRLLYLFLPVGYARIKHALWIKW
jgi:hypothetical protein